MCFTDDRLYIKVSVCASRIYRHALLWSPFFYTSMVLEYNKKDIEDNIYINIGQRSDSFSYIKFILYGRLTTKKKSNSYSNFLLI